jgi:hypothetical protein
MSHEHEDIDARLARLASATSGIQPRPGFAQQVMQRIGPEPVFTLAALQRPALRILPVFALAAALSLVWAASVQGDVYEAMAVSDDTELSW